MCIIPRGFGKTTLITQFGQLWLHLQDPDLATFTGSEATARAWQFLASIRKISDGSDPFARFTWLYGNWCSPQREWRADYAVHAARKAVSRKEPSFGCWGVEKTITGMHPDVGFLDDPISYEAMATHSSWLQIVNDHVDALSPIFSGNALLIFPGTRYADGDHLGRSLRIEGVRSWAGMPQEDYVPREGGLWDVYFLKARDSAGSPIYPKKWPESELKAFENKNNLRYFAQMMNDPTSSEYQPLSPGHIAAQTIPMKNFPPVKDLWVMIHMDTAFKKIEQQSHGDESVMIAMAEKVSLRDGHKYYIEGHGSNHWNMNQYLDKLIWFIRRLRERGFRVRALTDEDDRFGKSGTWADAIKTRCSTENMEMPQFVSITRGRAKKASRIINAAGYVADGLVWFPDVAIGVENLISQLLRINQSEHDDWADAFADAFNPLVYTPPSYKGNTPIKNLVSFPGDEILKKNPDADADWRKIYDREIKRDAIIPSWVRDPI